MCLAKAYYSKGQNQPLLEDIAHVRLRENTVELEDLFGQEKVVPGRVIEINFSTSKIFIEPSQTSGNTQ